MRLIRSGDLAPAENLALDEALLRSGEETLRLYGWDPPGLSIGFFQGAAEFEDSSGFQLVRRPTGGGAIAHTGEVTVAWIGRRRPVDRVYARVNRWISSALHRFGIEVGFGRAEPEAAPKGLCFDAHTRYDLLATGGKVFGSAQRRAGDRFLLHGTLVLKPNPMALGAISLSEILHREVTRHEAELALISEWNEPLRAAPPTKYEWAHAHCLVLQRYGNDAWTRRR